MSGVLLTAERPGPPLSLEALLRMSLPAITLPEMSVQTDLQTRVDRKYIIERSILDRMITDLGETLSCLTIDGRTVARYRSVYFDTPELAFFHQHLQGRRHRFKVRTRSYLDSDTTVLEVKSKGFRSATVKQRLPWTGDADRRLEQRGDDFVADAIGSEVYRGALVPVLETQYRRTTLVDESSQSRITCDTELRFRKDNVEAAGPRDEVLVETKSVGGRCGADRWMHDQGVRPRSLSKYCLGVALLYPQVRANPWLRVLRRHFDAPPQQ